MITDQQISRAYSDLKDSLGGLRDDYFGLLYLEQEHGIPRERAKNQIAFDGNEYGIDGFHFDLQRRNLYLYQFKYTDQHANFKSDFKRLIDAGVERVFGHNVRDPNKSPMLLQLRSRLHENRAAIDQVCFRFVFRGDPQEAEQSKVLESLREQLENKKYLAEEFFAPRNIGFLVEFRSSEGKVGSVSTARERSSFVVSLDEPVVRKGPSGEEMHVGFIRLADLVSIYRAMGSRFFDRNIRYGLKETEFVNRSLSAALKSIALDDKDDAKVFAFNHNGVTLFAEQLVEEGKGYKITAPSLLNGAQTVVTARNFLDRNKDNGAFSKSQFDAIRVLAKVIIQATPRFVTTVTVNNNRQNPVEPWNLRANDEIQLELQDKFRADVSVYYERQENAFDQLSPEDLADYGIKEDSKALQMLKLTQTFLLTDGNLSRLSEMRAIFEDDKNYGQVFRQTRLKADTRRILLCYKVQFRLRKVANEIEQKGQNKYSFVHRARYLLWALVCQGLLNHENADKLAETYGSDMTLTNDFQDLITEIATTRVRPLLSGLLELPEYASKVAEANFSFMRTDAAFDKCMEAAGERWGWVHKKLA